MDNFMLYSLMLSSLVFIICGIARVLFTIWWRPKWVERQLQKQGISGRPYKLLIGDIKDINRMTTEAWSKPIHLTHQIVQRVDPFMLDNVQKYGKVSLSWFGKTPRVIIKDPELMKQVLSNKQGHFQKPESNPLILILSRGLVTLEGEKWAKHRKMMNPAFHLQKLKAMIPNFATSCSMMIDEWKKIINDQKSCEIDVCPELQKLTADAISRTAFGSNYEEGKIIFQLQKDLGALTIEALRNLYVPGLRFLPTQKNRRRNFLDKEITSMLKSIIQKKAYEIETGQSPGDDLLSLLLRGDNQKSSTEKGAKMTIEEVIEECKLFYIAGQETTSTWLSWTIIVLAMHPDWQEKAREEVLQVCKDKEPDFEALAHLKIVTMVLYEVMRLYPPAITLIYNTRTATKIGEIHLPSGVDIALPMLLLHHDPELWGDDVEEFRPERFAEGVSKASKDQRAFFPFGWGPRICIGQNFATLEAKMALAMILQNFSFELSPSYSHAPYSSLTLQPQHGAHIILHKL